MIEIQEDHLLDLLHWARRYCDRRATYTPYDFNRIYNAIMLSYPFILDRDEFDKTLMNQGEFFPYAQDGMYNKDTNAYNALPKNPYRKVNNS